jgi:uncharacterized protein (DUF1330 family)
MLSQSLTALLLIAGILATYMVTISFKDWASINRENRQSRLDWHKLLGRCAMAYVMFQYDRLTDTHNWNSYNQQVRDWIAQLLQTLGAMSFMAYRTAVGASPNTITMLEFPTVEDARQAVGSEPIRAVLQALQSVGVTTRTLVVERSPFTPEPIQAGSSDAGGAPSTLTNLS